MAQIITVTVTSSIYKVLGDYLQDSKTPAYPSDLKDKHNKTNGKFDFNKYAKNFLSYVSGSDNQITNQDQIKNGFKNQPQKVEDINNLIASNKFLDIPIKPGIKFSIPLNKISKQSLLSQGIEVISNDEPAFKAQALIDLEKDSGYKKLFSQDNSNISFGDLTYQYPDFTVWIWCRSLSDNNSPFSSELKGQIFNVTPFVTNLTTSNTKAGGNFTLNLSPINAEKDAETGQWVLKKGTVLNIDDNQVVTESFIHEIINVNGTNKLVRSQYLLHNIIGTNDLVFIRFETLEKEAQQRLKDNANFFVDKTELPNRIYDMIAMVDSNSITSQYENNDVQISIRGRDLSKLFIDDGTYFYSNESKEGVFYLQGGASSKNQFTQRIISDNAYLYLGLYYNNSIEDIIKFVIQQLSTIKVVPDDLFSAYSGQSKNTDGSLQQPNVSNSLPDEIKQTIDKRNTQFKQQVFSDGKQADALKTDLEKRKQSLIKKEQTIIGQVHDFRYAQYSLNDVDYNEINSNQSTVVYNQLKIFVNYILNNTTANKAIIAKIEQNKLVGWRAYNNVLEDTFPSDFLTTNPDTPYSFFNEITDLGFRTLADDTQGIIQAIYNVLREQNELQKANFIDNPQQQANGIWQIVKLVIDKKVAKRLLIDSSLSSATGSIMNFFKKACQEPFVEIFMDTYYDQFYVIVRQPPTNKSGILSYLTGNYQATDNLNDNDGKITAPAVIELNDIDIVAESLTYSDSNIYSWYHFTPQSVFINGSEKYSSSFLPALNFPEYSDIWGSKSLDFIHNYTNYYAQYSKDSQDGKNNDLSQFQKQAYYDMQYIVESNAYRPFTREGSITLQGGDRRIKIGNIVRLVATGEIFMVDSVSNTISISGSSIDRSTTLQVSRGMKEAFIYGVKGSVLNEYFKGYGLKFTNEKIFSYFDIIDTKLNFNKKRTVTKYKTITVQVPQSDVAPSTDFDKIEGGYEDVVLTDEQKDVRKSSAVQTGLNLFMKDKLSELNAAARPKFEQFVNKLILLGWQVIITSSTRTLKEQAELKKTQNLNASPENSKHVKGLAIDINVIATKNINGIKAGVQLIKGKDAPTRAYWNKYWIQSGIPTIAKSYGLTWGGFYASYKDNVHFELTTPNNSTAQPVNYITETKEVPDGIEEVTDQEAIFSNFKVDQEIFNFFVRKQQEGYYSDSFNIFNKLDNISNIDQLIDNKVVSEDQLNQLSLAEKNNLKQNIINNSIKNTV